MKGRASHLLSIYMPIDMAIRTFFLNPLRRVFEVCIALMRGGGTREFVDEELHSQESTVA